MMIDFSNCKTPADVRKVLEKSRIEHKLNTLREAFERAFEKDAQKPVKND